MKRRSKLFLLVSAIIFSVGVIICLVGVGVAGTTGEQIYAGRIGEDKGYTYSFAEVDKIKISVSGADITVMGGAESSYIEVINFNENLCSYSGNNAMITFKETGEVSDITGIWESGLSFKGLRYILRPVPKDMEKKVNIYLSDSEHIKVFDIELERGNIKISDTDTVEGYDIDIESGKITVSKVTASSGIDITETGDMACDVKFSHVSANIIKLEAKRAKFEGSKLVFDNCEMKVNAGNAAFDFVPMKEDYTISIKTIGKLTVDGEVYHDKYTYPEGDGPATAPEDGDSEPSSLIIEANDFTVNIETPAKASIQAADSENIN